MAEALLDMQLDWKIEESKVLGRWVLDELTKIGVAHNPQIEQAGFAVLKAPDVPSVLIEMGFISNRQDYNLLINEEYRRGIMKHLSNVVDQYLEKR